MPELDDERLAAGAAVQVVKFVVGGRHPCPVVDFRASDARPSPA